MGQNARRRKERKVAEKALAVASPNGEDVMLNADGSAYVMSRYGWRRLPPDLAAQAHAVHRARKEVPVPPPEEERVIDALDAMPQQRLGGL